MHQDVGAGPVHGPVEGVGVADVERARPATLAMDLRHAHRIHALGRLPVAFMLLGAELARPLADGIGGKQLEPVVLLHPQLEFGLGLEDADHDRVAERQALLGQAGAAFDAGQGGLRDRLPGSTGAHRRRRWPPRGPCPREATIEPVGSAACPARSVAFARMAEPCATPIPAVTNAHTRRHVARRRKPIRMPCCNSPPEAPGCSPTAPVLLRWSRR